MSFLYSSICKEIEQKISNGFYAPGTRIPSIAERRATYQVSHITVLRVYCELESRGLIAHQTDGNCKPCHGAAGFLCAE